MWRDDMATGSQPSVIQRRSSTAGAWSSHATSPRMDQYKSRMDSGCMGALQVLWTGTRLRLLRLSGWLGPHVPAGSAIEPLDRSHRLAPFEVCTAAASTELLWRRRQAC